MAVKVMVAPAIAKGELAKPSRVLAKKGPGSGPGEGKPRKRRSSVYDADGNEVFITLMCLKCHKMRPLSQFGLRKMADGAIRNQPWCRTCRSGAGEKAGEKRGKPDPAEIAESSPAEASPPAPGDVVVAEAPRRAASTMAADIAAALAGGRR